jgi:hypothetical protein
LIFVSKLGYSTNAVNIPTSRNNIGVIESSHFAADFGKSAHRMWE